jgi:hypothetical protein
MIIYIAWLTKIAQSSYRSRLSDTPINRKEGSGGGRVRAEHDASTPASLNLAGSTNDGQPAQAVIEEEGKSLQTTTEHTILLYHHRFSHVSVAKLQT